MKSGFAELARTLVLGLTLLTALAVVCGYFSETVPFFDTLAHFRAHGVAALLVLALALILFKRVAVAVPAAAIAAYAALSVVPFLVPRTSVADRPSAFEAGAPGTLSLLQMNLRFDADPEPALALIDRLDPDILTLQEVDVPWVKALSALEADYPHRALCGAEEAGVSGVAIFSRLPFAEAPALCRPYEGFVARRIMAGPRRPVTIVSEHLEWPWPFGQHRQFVRLRADLARLPAPIVVAGDFNATPWSATVERYADATKTRPVTGIGATWLDRRLFRPALAWVGLPIDNVLVSKGIDVARAERQPSTASDHRPILVRFGVPAQRSHSAVTARSPAPPMTPAELR
ncbi:endonuclease/exonuclease/phosphatase family protein [Jiella marina]|uniref:endonuclease/exonuclease/phosphatase family protein n=1 Tax=Jiella sp. LLJ827 TaxID=2917712 RepID=UPI0021006D3E|nr:endonuclease/exonuclease/phosphatase family protein [Jiella sp. LLJ827]MCQ0987184.1 endonuclease/exonuclease/phosphatase family protein [Jiella sp. LLJ827]